MAYIKLEDLQRFPIRGNHYDKEHGSEHFVNGVETVLEYAEFLPKYEEGLCPQWISVDERLPEDGSPVVVCLKSGGITIARYDMARGRFRTSRSIIVTHWMPLPKPPKGE